ncbi:MAG: globin domain-containing protein, partial [Pseudoxanthomonas sp.]
EMTAPLVTLGARHRGYGVVSLDYDKVGEALMSALYKHLGDDFNEPARAAWGKAYFFIATTMHALPA